MGGSDTNLKVDDARTDKDASTLTLFYYELSTRNNTLTERALNNSHKLRIHPFDEISRAESARRVWPAQLQTSYGWSYIDCTYPERSSNKPDQLGAR